MSEKLSRWDRMIKAVYSDPKFKAQSDWFREYGWQGDLMSQVPRWEAERFVRTGEWADPDRTVRLVFHDPPDFDWWEPRYDQPGRREQARYRELGL